VRPLAPSPMWMLVTPYCKRTRPGRGTNTKAAGFPPLSRPSPATSLPPFALGLASTHLGWGTRRHFTRRLRDPPISKRRQCLRHSTKTILHSVKALPSVTLGKERSANCTSATASLPITFCRALDKEFAECHLVLGKEKSPSWHQVTVTDPLPSVFFGTQQRKVTVTAPSDGDRSFAECLLWHSAKRPILPSVCYHGPRQRRLQWAPPPVPVPRALVGTQQRMLLCRVSTGLALGKESSSGPLCQFLCRVSIGLALGKESSSGPLCQSLCRVRWAALGKGSFFVECLDHNTRQRRLYLFTGVLVCRVPWS
jgi:hypothetical protein